MNDFYVYILAYPDGRVFYVGKGTANRIIDHEREARNGGNSERCTTIRDIWAQDGQVLKRKLYQNLSEQDALAIESVLIDLFDRANLANGQSGHKQVPTLPKRKAPKKESPRIIGYKSHSYVKDGLYFEDCEPIYEEVAV